MGRRKRYAAIDVGSHEIRLYIAELPERSLPRVVEKVRRTLSLGSDTYSTGEISQSLASECISILSGFTEKLSEYNVQKVHAVATSAFREAENSTFVVDQINRHTGISVQVLTNAEEKYFHTIALAELMPEFEELIRQGTMVVDIGSGSVQATAYDRGDFLFSQNMLLGSLRIRELLADLQRLTSDYAALLEEYISSDLDNYRSLEPKNMSYKHMVILCGDLPYIARIAAALKPGEPENNYLSKEAFELVYQRLLTDQPLGLTVDFDIPAENATLLLPTAMIIHKLFKFTGAPGFHMPSVSLSDGLLIDMAMRQADYRPKYDQTRDIISDCQQVASRFRIDPKHTEYVEKAALTIFDATTKLHRLGPRSRLLLQLAAILHDSGKYINMSRHDIRSYNIIMSLELIGLSLEERRIAAFTARFHSGYRALVTDSHFMELPEMERLQISKLSAILRLANALDTGHKQKIKDIEIQIDAQTMTLVVSSSRDIMLEQWSLARSGQLFRTVYGLTPSIRIRRRHY